MKCITTSSLSPPLLLPVPVPEAIDPYVNASKTVLKQGEPLSVNCTVHGVELVFFSWDVPNSEVSRSKAEEALLFSIPSVNALRLHGRAQIASRCRDTPQILSFHEIVLTTHGVGILISAFYIRKLQLWFTLEDNPLNIRGETF